MSASVSPPLWARKAVVLPTALLAVAAAVTSVTMSQQSASGSDDGTSAEFTVVGDGKLPTERPELGAVRAPLSAAETGYAISVASSDASVPAGATDVHGKPGAQFLFADLPETPDNTERTAVVTLYDYTSNTGFQQVVNLKKGKVVSSETAATLQPAIASDEADAAMAVAIASDADLALFDDFEAAQGVPLVSADQVSYVAGTFVYDQTTTTGKECGEDRCAQLMVQTASGAYLNTWDFVVNLSDKSVVKIK